MKHKSENDCISEDEQSRSSSKKESHHHKRKHKKSKQKIDEFDRNGNDNSPMRSEVIEVHGSSSEGESRNGTKYDHHNRKNNSHSSRHHLREVRRHRKRRKRSRSNSDTQSRDREMEIRHKKTKVVDRGERRESYSDSETQKLNEHRKRSREESSSRSRDEDGHRGIVKNRSEAKGKVKSRFEINVRRLKEEPDERESNRRNNPGSDASRRINREGPSGSRDNLRRRGSGEREVLEWGPAGGNRTSSKKPVGEVQKPNFGLSGKLTEDTNTFNGVVIKYSEPPEARMPKKRWRLYPFKGDEALPPLYIHRQSAYLLGRDRKVVDMPIDHPSCSKQHAALQYRLVTFERPNGSVGKQIRLYIIDLESANGTFINNKKIEPKKYVELFEKDVIKFGFSSREYVLLHEHSKDDDPGQDDT